MKVSSDPIGAPSAAAASRTPAPAVELPSGPDGLAGLAPPLPPGTVPGSHPPVPDWVLLGLLFPALALALLLLVASLLALR